MADHCETLWVKGHNHCIDPGNVSNEFGKHCSKESYYSLASNKNSYQKWLLALASRDWWRHPIMHQPDPLVTSSSTKKIQSFTTFSNRNDKTFLILKCFLNSSLAQSAGELWPFRQNGQGCPLTGMIFCTNWGVWARRLQPETLEGNKRALDSDNNQCKKLEPKNVSLGWRPGPCDCGQILKNLLPLSPLSQKKSFQFFSV